MRVIPAIDLKDGQCVRLQKGDYGTAHKVAENPVETAQRFLDAGADLVHMVDLDAAKDGSHANYGVVEQVIRETGATVELGGGVRSMQDVETVLALGVSRVIIGSAAVRHPEFVAEAVKKYGDKIVVGIDAKSETVRTDGWLDDSGENYIASVSPIPLLLIHGKADHVIPWQHSEKLYSLAKEPKRLILIPDGEHIDAFSDRHGDVYREQMVDFILSALNPQN